MSPDRSGRLTDPCTRAATPTTNATPSPATVVPGVNTAGSDAPPPPTIRTWNAAVGTRARLGHSEQVVAFLLTLENTRHPRGKDPRRRRPPIERFPAGLDAFASEPSFFSSGVRRRRHDRGNPRRHWPGSIVASSTPAAHHTARVRRDPKESAMRHLARWNALAFPFESPASRLLEEWSRNADAPFATTFAPPVDVIEHADGVTLVFDLPDFDPAALDVRVENGVLTVSGERTATAEDPKVRFIRRERHTGRFARQFSLPTYVDPEHVKAESKNGVLRISLPRRDESKPRSVKVQVN